MTLMMVLPVVFGQLLLRGCVLRNTAWVCGLVVFTGHQSKVMMNSTAAPSKRSTLEQQLDLLIIFMFGLLASMCLVDAIGSAVWINKVGYTSTDMRRRTASGPYLCRSSVVSGQK